MKYQYHLNAKNCSGRGIRIQVLEPAECQKIFFMAAKDVGQDATVFELNAKVIDDGVRAMVYEVTKEKGLKDLVGAGVEWVKVGPEALETDYAKWFNAKDDKLLKRLWREHHEIAEEELDAISGKAIALAD